MRLSSRNVAGAVGAALALSALMGCGSDSTKPEDTTYPARVTDLAVVEVSDSTVTLAWTAPGDDGTANRAARYELRYLNAPFAELDWEATTPVASVPAPAAPGSAEQVTVRGLPVGERQYFGLRTADEVPNLSVLSNLVYATPGPPRCVVTPDSLAFGALALGGSFDISFTIQNEGGGTLSGDVEALCEDFTIPLGGGVFHLRAGQKQSWEVHFSPSSQGEKSCRIETGLACGAVPCTGTGATLGPGLVTVQVGAGEVFLMGSPAGEAGRDSVDESSHEVRLTHSFEVADHEVTQAEWRALMGWNESSFPGADRPVEHVTWFDAVDYCNRLSQHDGLDPAYDMGQIIREGNHITGAGVVLRPHPPGYRLLTEAEWEYCCRAGTTTAFSSGPISQTQCNPPDPALDTAGWYCGNSAQASHPAKQKQPNARGLFDLHGNVSEWCWDLYSRCYGQESSPGSCDSVRAAVDPSGSEFGESRIIRGGSWGASAAGCRSAFRLYHPPGRHYSDVGFRIGRTLP